MSVEDRVVIKTLMEIKESVGKLEGKLDVITENYRKHDDLDRKWHEKIDERLDEYNDQLIIHIRRSELLEEEVEKLKPLRKFSEWATLSVKLASALLAIAGILKLFGLV